MCGIAGIHRRTGKRVRYHQRLAAELLLAIENRGRDSTGFLAMYPDGRVVVEKETVPAGKFVRYHRVTGMPVTTLLHTRFATVGTVNRRNAHPVRNGRMAAVHNGTIYNDDATFHRLGRRRNAQVDSEVIPAVVDHYGWHQAAKALSRLRGGAATAIVDVKTPGELLLARLSGYPLVMLVTPHVVVWASTRQAIERAWKKTYGTDPRGEWIDVDEWTLYRVNGQIVREDIPKPKPPRKPPRFTFDVPAPKRTKTKKTATTATSGSSPSRRTGRLTPSTDPFDSEPWMEDTVRDLMRLAGVSRAVAEDMVYGTTIGRDDNGDDLGAIVDGEWWGLEGFSLEDSAGA
jgi:predicted glutamine amidotransferase